MHAYCCLDMQSIPPAMSHHYLSSEARIKRLFGMVA